MSFAQVRMPEGSLERATRAAAAAWGLLSKSALVSGMASGAVEHAVEEAAGQAAGEDGHWD